MPVFNEEYGTDWATVLPEIGKQISSVIKARQDAPAQTYEYMMREGIKNPAIFNDMAVAKSALGAKFDEAGWKAAIASKETPEFQAAQKAFMDAAAQVGLQNELAETQIKEIPAQTELQRKQLEATIRHTERVEFISSDEKKFLIAQHTRDKEIDLKLSNNHLEEEKIQAALINSVKGSQQEKDALDRLQVSLDRQADDLFKSIAASTDALIKTEGKLSREAKAAVAFNIAVSYQRYWENIKKAQDKGLNPPSKTAATQMLHALYIASGNDPDEFARMYTTVINSLPEEQRIYAKEDADRIIKASEPKPGFFKRVMAVFGGPETTSTDGGGGSSNLKPPPSSLFTRRARIEKEAWSSWDEATRKYYSSLSTEDRVRFLYGWNRNRNQGTIVNDMATRRNTGGPQE